MEKKFGMKNMQIYVQREEEEESARDVHTHILECIQLEGSERINSPEKKLTQSQLYIFCSRCLNLRDTALVYEWRVCVGMCAHKLL